MFPCFITKHQLRIVSPRRNSILGIVLRHIWPKKFIKIFLEPVNWNELIKNQKVFSSVLFYGLGLDLYDVDLYDDESTANVYANWYFYRPD